MKIKIGKYVALATICFCIAGVWFYTGKDQTIMWTFAILAFVNLGLWRKLTKKEKEILKKK